MYPKTLNRVHVFWGISGKTMGEGHRNKNIKNTRLRRKTKPGRDVILYVRH